jgi:hypothetical protein
MENKHTNKQKKVPFLCYSARRFNKTLARFALGFFWYILIIRNICMALQTTNKFLRNQVLNKTKILKKIDAVV